MAEKKKGTLTELLQKFAEASEDVPMQGQPDPQAMQAAPQQDVTSQDEVPDDTQGEAQAPEDIAGMLNSDEPVSSLELAGAAAQAAAAEQQADNAGDQLAEIAQQYIDDHNEALGKEAQIFGHIFANAAVNEMNKQAGFFGGYPFMKNASLKFDDAEFYRMLKMAEDESDDQDDDSGSEDLSDDEEQSVAQAAYDAVIDQLSDLY